MLFFDFFSITITNQYFFSQNCLEEAKNKKKAEIANLENKCTDLKNIMSELKTQLYAKFGSRINLESEESD